jgi:hypothetical protein
MKKVKVIFSPDAEEVYKYLNEASSQSKIERSILNAVNKKIELVKANFHYGEPIAKKLIPQEYKTNYGVVNLFRVELPNFWRMLYTLTDGESEIEIIAFVLDILDHDQYNKKFGYRRK